MRDTYVNAIAIFVSIAITYVFISYIMWNFCWFAELGGLVPFDRALIFVLYCLLNFVVAVFTIIAAHTIKQDLKK